MKYQSELAIKAMRARLKRQYEKLEFLAASTSVLISVFLLFGLLIGAPILLSISLFLILIADVLIAYLASAEQQKIKI